MVYCSDSQEANGDLLILRALQLLVVKSLPATHNVHPGVDLYLLQSAAAWIGRRCSDNGRQQTAACLSHTNDLLSASFPLWCTMSTRQTIPATQIFTPLKEFYFIEVFLLFRKIFQIVFPLIFAKSIQHWLH